MGRSPCCDKNGLKKGPWTPEEDLKLMQYIQAHGPGNWRTLPKNAAARLPGRTDNEIKNYWNTHIRKRLLRMGIDPVTHSPRLDLLDLSSLLNSAQINLSSLLGLQTLVNPEVLRFLTTLIASNNNNEENPEILLQKLQENDHILNQNHHHAQMLQNQIIPCPTSNEAVSCSLNHQIPSMQMQEQTFQEMLNIPSQNYVFGISDQISIENSAFNSQNLNLDSVLSSTPNLSNSPLNSSSTNFVNSSSTEDERESYCSNLMKFEIPASLDFDDFM
ncbi:hypothetical protein M9H77_20072 [Catharanthus roseus]|uniref:Uncharacterized protein n=1 Tax=Catharanthus roseus TaxID=4058 RepID=A0ACC0AKP6_CATRO|nr:hypothetical protein M9H77_20072 [Catharanthus roseus]